MPLYTVPGSWIDSLSLESFATNRTGGALVANGVYAFDLSGSDGDVDVYTTTATDPFSNLISVAAAHDDGWLLAVAFTTTANDAQGKVRIRGVGDVLCKESSNVGIGVRVSAVASQTYVQALTNGLACCGISVEAGPTGGSAAAAQVWFDGVGNAVGAESSV
jgi:hypothetical protein